MAGDEGAAEKSIYKTWVAWISSNAAGQYSATGLPSGTYYAATWNSAGYINEVYNNIRCVGYCSDFAAATPITVTAGATTAGRNFDLDLGLTKRGDWLLIQDGRGGGLRTVDVADPAAPRRPGDPGRP